MRFIAAFTIVTLLVIKEVDLTYRDGRLSLEPKKIPVGTERFLHEREDTISNVVKTLLQRAPHDEIFLHSTNGATLLSVFAHTNFTIAPKNHLISKFGLSPLSRVLDHVNHPLKNEKYISWWRLTSENLVSSTNLERALIRYSSGVSLSPWNDMENSLLSDFKIRLQRLLSDKDLLVTFPEETILAGRILHALQSAMRLYHMSPKCLEAILDNRDKEIRAWLDETDINFFKKVFGELYPTFERQLEMFEEIFDQRNFSSITIFSDQVKETLKNSKERIITVFYAYSFSEDMEQGYAKLGAANEVKISKPAKLGQEIQGILTNNKDAVERLLKQSGFNLDEIQIHQCRFESRSLNFEDFEKEEVQKIRKESEAREREEDEMIETFNERWQAILREAQI